MKNMYFIMEMPGFGTPKSYKFRCKTNATAFYRGLKKDHKKDGFKGSIWLFTYQSDSENEMPSMNDLKPLKIEHF